MDKHGRSGQCMLQRRKYLYLYIMKHTEKRCHGNSVRYETPNSGYESCDFKNASALDVSHTMLFKACPVFLVS